MQGRLVEPPLEKIDSDRREVMIVMHKLGSAKARCQATLQGQLGTGNRISSVVGKPSAGGCCDAHRFRNRSTSLSRNDAKGLSITDGGTKMGSSRHVVLSTLYCILIIVDHWGVFIAGKLRSNTLCPLGTQTTCAPRTRDI